MTTVGDYRCRLEIDTYEGLETSCQRWHSDMTDIVDQQ
jgi:hypothetical protein